MVTSKFALAVVTVTLPHFTFFMLTWLVKVQLVDCEQAPAVLRSKSSLAFATIMKSCNQSR